MAYQPLHIAYLDDYHAGDVLFVQSLARSLARMRTRRVVLLHGSGEHAERALEAQGIFRKRERGILPIESPAEHGLVERVLRHVNRKITGVLTDAVVPAVSVIGSERGLFQVRAGQLYADNVDWLERLALQGVVPVVATNAVDEDRGTGEVPMPLAAAALAREIETDVRIVVFTKTNLPGIMKEGGPIQTASLNDVDNHVAVPSEALADLVERFTVLLTNTTRMSDEGGPTGTQIRKPT